jgi:hypothetical protein
MALPLTNSFSRIWMICGALFLGLVGQGFAVDRYVLDVPTSVNIGEKDVLIRVTPLASGRVDETSHSVEFVNLLEGIEIHPVDPVQGMVVRGPTDFKLSVGMEVRPGAIGPVCQKVGNPSIQGSAAILLERPAAQFVLSLLPPSVETPLLPQIQIIALDVVGAVVTSYNGEVRLRPSLGVLKDDRVPGDQFSQGVARVSLSWEGLPPSGTFQCVVEEMVPSRGQTELARGEALLKMRAPRK